MWTVDLAAHPCRIILWIVVNDVGRKIRLEGDQTGWKRLVEFAQGGRARANHKHTVHFDGAKVTVVGGLIGRGKDMRLDLHGQEVVTVGANVGRMR